MELQKPGGHREHVILNYGTTQNTQCDLYISRLAIVTGTAHAQGLPCLKCFSGLLSPALHLVNHVQLLPHLPSLLLLVSAHFTDEEATRKA